MRAHHCVGCGLTESGGAAIHESQHRYSDCNDKSRCHPFRPKSESDHPQPRMDETMTATPHFFEHRDITVKVDQFTLGAIVLACAVGLYVWIRSGRRTG